MNALRISDAPYWAVTEWFYKSDHGEGEMEWFLAIANTLSIQRIKYMCIYNWGGINENQAAVAAVRVATKFR
jgi:hypothetical protein